MSDLHIELTREELASIRAPLDRALTLPARAFNSRAFFDLEVERIFQRRWMAVAFEATLPSPGDMRPIELFGQPLALVRGDDGTLRAFHNICPYDGCLAVREEQRGACEIEVYYHGWRYDLRGRLLAAPYWGGTPAGDPGCLEGRGADLVEIRSECRLGLLFVDLGGQAGRLDDHLAPMHQLLEEYDLDRAVPVEDDDVLARSGRTVEANWKTYIENAAINILHEGFTHEAYRRSPDVPRVREGEKTFFTVRDGSLLAFGFRMSDVAQHLRDRRQHSAPRPFALGPAFKGLLRHPVSQYRDADPGEHVPARDLSPGGPRPQPDPPVRQLPSRRDGERRLRRLSPGARGALRQGLRRGSDRDRGGPARAGLAGVAAALLRSVLGRAPLRAQQSGRG